MSNPKKVQTPPVQFNDYGNIAYVIQIDKSEKNYDLQRHLWLRTDGSVEIQDWIKTNKSNKRPHEFEVSEFLESDLIFNQ
jgi:hypothetical protein